MFLGTPAFAVPSLAALARLTERGIVQVAAVVTQPDRQASRGAVQPPAVKRAALDHGLSVLQPDRLDGDAVARIAALAPDALVWAAYGNRIPRGLLDLVGGRALNVHASLLPRWRGAAPIAHAILAGDEETGVTLMEGTAALDAGPIVAQARTRIGPSETRGELEARLAELGAELLERELPRYLRREIAGRPQDGTAATLAPKLDPARGELDFARPAEELVRVVRAYTPDPGAFVRFRGRRIGITRASVAGGTGVQHGTVRVVGGAPRVAAGAGWLQLDAVLPAGTREMSGAAWARGVRDLSSDGRVPS